MYLFNVLYTEEARKCMACLNGVLWSKDIRKERKLNIYNALIKSSLLYGSEHGDWQKIIKDGWKLQRWMPWEDPPEYQEKIELEM